MSHYDDLTEAAALKAYKSALVEEKRSTLVWDVAQEALLSSREALTEAKTARVVARQAYDAAIAAGLES